MTGRIPRSETSGMTNAKNCMLCGEQIRSEDTTQVPAVHQE